MSQSSVHAKLFARKGAKIAKEERRPSEWPEAGRAKRRTQRDVRKWSKATSRQYRLECLTQRRIARKDAKGAKKKKTLR